MVSYVLILYNRFPNAGLIAWGAMKSFKGLFVFASLILSIPLSAWASPPTCEMTATETGIAWRTEGAGAAALTAWSGDGSIPKNLSYGLAGFLSYVDLRETFPVKTECTGPMPWLVGDYCSLALTATALNGETCSARLDFYKDAKAPNEPATELDRYPSSGLAPYRPALPELDQMADSVNKVPPGVLGDKPITTLPCRLSVTLSGILDWTHIYDIAWSSGVNVKEAAVSGPSGGEVFMPDGTSFISSESPISKELEGTTQFHSESYRTANVVLTVTTLDGGVRQAACALGAMDYRASCVASCKVVIPPAPLGEIGGGSDTEAVPLEGAGFLDRFRRVVR